MNGNEHKQPEDAQRCPQQSVEDQWRRFDFLKPVFFKALDYREREARESKAAGLRRQTFFNTIGRLVSLAQDHIEIVAGIQQGPNPHIGFALARGIRGDTEVEVEKEPDTPSQILGGAALAREGMRAEISTIQEPDCSWGFRVDLRDPETLQQLRPFELTVTDAEGRVLLSRHPVPIGAPYLDLPRPLPGGYRFRLFYRQMEIELEVWVGDETWTTKHH